MKINTKDGYSTIVIQTETLKELREFVLDQSNQLEKFHTYSQESIDEFLIESLKILG